jgi:rhamnosyl/mannosyltransferase
VVVTQHADSRRSVYRPATRLVLRRAAAVVVPSRAHLALSTELTRFESKVEVIPFGIDHTRWEMVPPPPPGASPRAIFIGRLVSYKGLDILLRAMERVPELRLDIVGAGPEGPRLRTLAQALAITHRVRWYGEYPDEDLPRRMADADFLVLPSVTVEEMFGLVVLEAMAAGRPVITAALPSAVRKVKCTGRDRAQGAAARRGRAGAGAGDAGAGPVIAEAHGGGRSQARGGQVHPGGDGGKPVALYERIRAKGK